MARSRRELSSIRNRQPPRHYPEPAPVPEPEPEPELIRFTDYIRWENLLHIRPYLGATVAGFVFVLFPFLIWGKDTNSVVVAVLFWSGFALGLFGNLFEPLNCSACGKRIKQGFSTCHHCGYVQGSAST